MRIVIGWLIVAVLVFVLLYIIIGNIYRVYAKAAVGRLLNGDSLGERTRAAAERYIGRHGKYEEQKRLYEMRIEYNRSHLPSVELPPLAPDWTAVDGFIMETRFSFTDEGDRFKYYAWINDSYETKYVLKSDFSGDTLKLIELLRKDVDWFYTHSLGGVVEEISVLKDFLRVKYPKLSDKSVDWIWFIYGKNAR